MTKHFTLFAVAAAVVAVVAGMASPAEADFWCTWFYDRSWC